MAEPSRTPAAAGNPTVVARETLKLLASRRIAPTPENYLRIYHEIAGTASEPGAALAAAPAPASDLGPLLRDVLRALDTPHRGVTPTRKREGIERLLIRFGSDPQLPDKLRGLMRSWAEGGARDPAEPGAAPGAVAEPLPGALGDARELLAVTLEEGVAPRIERYADVHGETLALAKLARAAGTPEDWARLASQLKRLWIKVEMRVEPDAELIDNLLRLIALVVDNIGELVEEDQWIGGQIELLRGLVTAPIDLAGVRQAERGLREVIVKQSQLKSSLREAKASLKELLAVFVERLGEVTASTSGYHARIGRYAERIAATDSLPGLRTLVDELMSDTRAMQVDMLRARDDLERTRRQAQEAEQRVRQLEGELEKASDQIREDALTGALNRRGMDEALARELARAGRAGRALSVALLDIDDFKRLNDAHGHIAGDAALVHLARIIRHTVRPTDIIARMGGEEFVIVLPETSLDEAAAVTTRLQRELTRKFFLHNNERVLVTFSAGVTELRPGDTVATLLERADRAMYRAKQAGKNQVIKADG
jgi:diguanylate cyclase